MDKKNPFWPKFQTPPPPPPLSPSLKYVSEARGVAVIDFFGQKY